MQIASFLEHWSITENPFRAEEARQDDVFSRLDTATAHPDFEKVRGDLSRPASAVVFGEKGSGKTALRLQLQDAIAAHNAEHPEARSLVVLYDELNPVLDRLVRHSRADSPAEALESMRLVDHIDGVLHAIVPRLVSAAIGEHDEEAPLSKDDVAKLRKVGRSEQQAWVILQSLYDVAERSAERSGRLRRAMRLRSFSWTRPLGWLSLVLLLLCIGAGIGYSVLESGDEATWVHVTGVIATAVLTLVAGGKWAQLRLRLGSLARKIAGQLRVVDRSVDSFRVGLESIPWDLLRETSLPVDDLDDHRYAMLDRLRRVVAPFGFKHIIVLLDRVDEPTLVSGDKGRMRAVVWPLFSNKLLQQDGVAFKMLLPLELRHELYRQTEDFFQSARLDKQNMIDRLTWSGATLYDLCSARLDACRAADAGDLSLPEIFAEDVSRQDIVDALDQMRQPRDAFKLMYQLIQEHCSNTTEEEESYRIPKFVLDHAKRAQSERLEGLHRGTRPA